MPAITHHGRNYDVTSPCDPFVAALLLAAPSLGAQQVTGRVLSQTGEPLAAVQVFIAGSGIGALTQQNGRYLLLNVPAGTHTLRRSGSAPGVYRRRSR